MIIRAVILAAGKGTRMKSSIPKVLHKVNGKSMIDYSINLSKSISDEKPVVVVGYESEQVISHIQDKADYVIQKEQLGTGDAVKTAFNNINENDDVLILCADTPLLTKKTIENMIKEYENADAIILTTNIDDPFGYGRVITDENNNFIKIVEQKDANEEEKKVKKINSGLYLVKEKYLKKYINSLNTNNSQNEYYLTDVFKMMKEDNLIVKTVDTNYEEVLGANNRIQLENIRKIAQRRINEFHMENGVTIINPETVYIDEETVIENDTIIYPNTYITNSKISSGCIIGPDCTINDSRISENVTIKYSYIEESIVNKNTNIGPYAHLRPKSNLGENVKIGNFVEVKNSTLGNNSKASHLAYVGDADIGKDVNIGCGVIFVNYDGVKKYRSTIKDKAFIGSNSNVVSPITVEEKGYIACGSTVTKDVPSGALCIAREKQRLIEGWVGKKFNK